MPTKDELKTNITALEGQIAALKEENEALIAAADNPSEEIADLEATIDALREELAEANQKLIPEDERKMVKLYWDHPITSHGGTFITAYGFKLKREKGRYFALVPENRVKDLCDRIGLSFTLPIEDAEDVEEEDA